MGERVIDDYVEEGILKHTDGNASEFPVPMVLRGWRLGVLMGLDG